MLFCASSAKGRTQEKRQVVPKLFATKVLPERLSMFFWQLSHRFTSCDLMPASGNKFSRYLLKIPTSSLD